MRYQGGKARTAARIAQLLPGSENYYEPFLGGGSVAAAVAKTNKFKILHLSDAQTDLVELWRAVLGGWIPPATMTKEEYTALRDSKAPSALRGWAAFAASHSGKYFGGYGTTAASAGRDYLAEAQRSIAAKVQALTSVPCSLTQGDYRGIVLFPGDTLYLDPPYADTEPYGGLESFDSEAFWSWSMTQAQRGVWVCVSEYSAPDGWSAALTINRSATLDPNSSKTNTEYLFMPTFQTRETA